MLCELLVVKGTENIQKGLGVMNLIVNFMKEIGLYKALQEGIYEYYLIGLALTAFAILENHRGALQ